MSGGARTLVVAVLIAIGALAGCAAVRPEPAASKAGTSRRAAAAGSYTARVR